MARPDGIHIANSMRPDGRRGTAARWRTRKASSLCSSRMNEETAVPKAAAEREKRREEAASWGPDKIREKCLERYHERMREYAQARTDYPPLRCVDPEEESPEPPMRYLSLGRGGPQLASSANILSIKVVKSTLGYPIDLYGTVFVRDELDRKRICVFRRDRDNCQQITSKVESLSLTGPYRGLLIFSNIYFEIDLRRKYCGAENDIELAKWCVKDKAVSSSSKPIRNRFVGKLSTIDLTYAPAHRAVEVAVQFKICEVLRIREKPNGSTVREWLPFNKKLKEHTEFHGHIRASIEGIHQDIVLYDSQAAGCAIVVGDEGRLELSRHVFAVPIDHVLSVKIVCHDAQYVFKRSPRICGGSSADYTIGPYELGVKVVWSALFSPKDDGMPNGMRRHGAAESCRGRC